MKRDIIIFMNTISLAQPPVVTLSRGDSGYPFNTIRLLGKRAPSFLYCIGNISLLSSRAVGFCGSRKASTRGVAVADDCAQQLAKAGFVVASGYAAGVDLAAHRGALLVGGCTLIVLPEGIDHFRIRKNLEDVWDWDRVLVISQFSPTSGWKAYRAMERNLLLISLSKAMIVVEAGSRGGTLHAGNSALKLHVPLYVAQYSNMESDAPGNHVLLCAGGKPLLKSNSTGTANLSSLIQIAKTPFSSSYQEYGNLPL